MLKRCISYGSLVLLVGIGLGSLYYPALLWALILVGPLLLVVVYDLFQTRHTILRNFPILGHFRYILEDFRHQFRQYLIQGDLEGEPIDRERREIAYKRAKGDPEVHPFGTNRDLYAQTAEWLEHSMVPVEADPDSARISVGGEDCTRPYLASRFNISAMSFGSLSKNAVLALNHAARIGGFAHNTGEGGISRYHREPGGDLIWEIGTGYFGCRDGRGRFDPEAFRERASDDQVKMIELKLSQGAKPSGGGLLPAIKVTADIAEARSVPQGEAVHSPNVHPEFDTPRGLLEFIARLRELSGGKPVGFKLCLGRRYEFMAIVKAMLATGIRPDYIVVDGAEGGTGAAQLEYSDNLGTPLKDALVFTHNALQGAGLRKDIRLVAAGKIVTAFDLTAKIAMGADMAYSARGMMFAIGCIQARRCHTNRCPSGVATQDPWLVSGLVAEDKGPRAARYHARTMEVFLELLGASGCRTPEELGPEHVYYRVSHNDVRSYAELYPYLREGQLLEADVHSLYAAPWAMADAETFRAVPAG